MRLKPCLIICSLVVSLAELAQAFTIIDWDKQQAFCGHRFPDVLSKYCLVHNSPDHNVGSYGGTFKTPKQECCDKYCSVRYILINYCTRVKENFMEKYNETWEKPKSDLLNEIVRESDGKRTDNHPAARSIINTMVMKGVSKIKGSGCKHKRPQRKRNKNWTKRNCRKHRATPITNKPSSSSLTPLKITKTIRKSRRKCICCRQKRIKAPKIHQDAKLGIEQGHQIPINLDFNIKDFINQ